MPDYGRLSIAGLSFLGRQRRGARCRRQSGSDRLGDCLGKLDASLSFLVVLSRRRVADSLAVSILEDLNYASHMEAVHELFRGNGRLVEGPSLGVSFTVSCLSSAHAKRTYGAPRPQSPRYSSHFPRSPESVSPLIRADGQARLALAGTSPGSHCRCVRLHMSTSTMRGRTDSVVLSGRRENYIAPAPHAARDITLHMGTSLILR